ncbi:peptidoglycan/xylan/chitin deacetylase (PgdA/CDA1 family) [Mycoplana sp. BE70]|uniref:polysaccharide deacetylase family protein n=1 Tax=Mycoplana sp. BE70 TaxID=2817775 RepID=UPI002858ECEE|nr:polysaccharide deacetylase [Mycoplana sp. BE70]MDR6755765.1 peptidoglycan/xylan/chitin deacetylase (PgdA/CDA1 family) [Mycoplana sp. BE70]
MEHYGPIKWPNGHRLAVMLSFDFDAETLWLSRDPENVRRPGTLSQGVYGAKVGVPMILETLSELQVPATFFVPGWTAEKYPGRLEMIVAKGHEVGHHGYLHEWVDPDRPELEEEVLVKGLEALKATVGVVPAGYRSPAWETSPNMIGLLKRYGFFYDSSFMDTINPYRHQLEDGTGGPIELPVHWSLDDAPFALFSVRTPRTIVTNDHLLKVWQDEFREIYRWGGLFNLTMHPQIIGRPSRIALLREFIQWMQTFPGVWFAPGRQIAEAWSTTEQ